MEGGSLLAKQLQDEVARRRVGKKHTVLGVVVLVALLLACATNRRAGEQ